MKGKPEIDYDKKDYARKMYRNGPPRIAHPTQAQVDENGYVIPQELKEHRALKRGKTDDPFISDEYAPFDFRASTATGPLAVKNRLLAGRLVKSRLSGMSYAQIGKNFGINPNAARGLVEKTLSETYPEEDIDTLRAITNAQYDLIIDSWFDAGTHEQDEKAAKVLLQTIDAKRKLSGIDRKPVQKTETTANVKIDLSEAAADILERYSSEIIDVDGVETENNGGGFPELEYNPQVEAMLQQNRRDNNRSEDGDKAEMVLVDEEFIRELEEKQAEGN